jgi:hypothetical protein
MYINAWAMLFYNYLALVGMLEFSFEQKLTVAMTITLEPAL